jgi:hypothetical protein
MDRRVFAFLGGIVILAEIMRFVPDPTFYPSPGMAMQAPPERLAYVALLNDGNNGKHDSMGVIDLDPEFVRVWPARRAGGFWPR